jgi:glc operon protein GlcG
MRRRPFVIAVALAAAAAAPGRAEVSAPEGAAAVRYYSRATVDDAFARGAVLFDGDAGARSYMVHASRRERAGDAEVHARDTDVIYVLGGTATFVTGGAVVDGRETAPDEVRGTSIRGGETRRLAAGDVVIVPNGTPHWFQDVAAPFTYFVVKVR